MKKLKITTQEECNSPFESSKKEIQQLNLIEHIEEIVEYAKGSKLSADFFKTVKPHTNLVGAKLELSDIQSVLLSLFIDFSDNCSIELKDLSTVIGCSNIALIKLMNDIDVLVQRRYINICKRNNNYEYSVPIYLIDAIRREIQYIPVQYHNLDVDSLFVIIEKRLESRRNDECSYGVLVDDLSKIVKNNQQLNFCQQIQKYEEEDNNFTILIAFCSLLVNDENNYILFDDFIELMDGKGWQRRIKREMQRGKFDLMREDMGLIEFVNDAGFENHEYFRLTKKAKEELLSDYNISTTEVKPTKEIITHTSIAIKELYYNDRETVQINQLESLLTDENFKNVQSRLAESGLRSGFACIFYGSPGTGKTETVYQIARKTGRDIMAVNISEIKSCWVGESEKNIKALFDRYRSYCKKSAVTPILLFNEADAVIGIRQEGATSGVDKMGNSIQNIILQEMETLDGIMIATTNLTQNLDKAFERRFLYKIEFGKPSIEAKQAIWQSMMLSLTEESAAELARTYDFSGGQIENIARKRAVETIILGVEPTLEVLHTFCQSELIQKTNNRKPIGY